VRASRRALRSPQRAAELQQRQQRQEAAVAALNKSFELGFDMGRLPRDAKSGQLELRFVVTSGALGPPPQAPSGGGQDAGVGARRRRAICYVGPAKVEVAFQRSSLYVGKYGANPRGGDSLQDSRRRFRAALEFFASGQEVLVSSAVLEGPALRQIRFIDGKHRFCAYRDLGLPCIPLLVPSHQRQQFNKLPGGSGRSRALQRTSRPNFSSEDPMLRSIRCSMAGWVLGSGDPPRQRLSLISMPPPPLLLSPPLLSPYHCNTLHPRRQRKRFASWL